MAIRLDHRTDELVEVHDINVTPFIDVMSVLLIRLTVVIAFSLALTCAAAAKSTTPVPLPRSTPFKNTEQENQQNPTSASALFSERKLPTMGKAMAIGYYPSGCLQGGVELPTTGPTWQAQPRGGPLPFGHKSHQIGLDVDIWFMPMPDRVLSKAERENILGSNVVAADGKRVDNKTWSPADVAFIRTAAEQPEVERVLVNAAIKKELCRVEGLNDRSWMSKVRPWYGHDDHIHVRLKCPADSPSCRAQPPVPGGDGCAADVPVASRAPVSTGLCLPGFMCLLLMLWTH